MQHFIRIASWIVTLLACLQVRSLPIADSNIESMLANVKCPSDSTFYAPKNVQKQCITTALDCVMRELDGTVTEECLDTNDDINGAIDFFSHTIQEQTEKGHAITNSSECACERWSQTSFQQFLTLTETLLLRTASKV